MHRKLFPLAIVIILLSSWLPLSLAQSTLPQQKQTVLGLYVTAKEAHEMWLADKNKIKILDVRTPEEYIFVGHAPMAHNIPFHVFNYKMALRNGAQLPEIFEAIFQVAAYAGFAAAWDALEKLAEIVEEENP